MGFLVFDNWVACPEQTEVVNVQGSGPLVSLSGKCHFICSESKGYTKELKVYSKTC